MKAPGIELEGGYRNTQDASNVDWWYGGGDAAYPDLATAYATIGFLKRYGLTFGVYNLSTEEIEEFWWPIEDQVGDGDEIRKNNKLEVFETLAEYTTKHPIEDRVEGQVFWVRNELDNNRADLYSLRKNKEAYMVLGDIDLSNYYDKDEISELLTLKADLTYVNEKDALLSSQIADIISIIMQPWTDVISFTYDGTNNIHELSFTPKFVGVTNFQNQTNLNPYLDYYYSANTIVLNMELTVGIEYKLITQYYK